MAYIHIGDDSFSLGSSGSGPNCPCASCKRASAHVGEWYVREEADTLEPARTAGRTLSALPHQNLPNLSYKREPVQSRGIGGSTRELGQMPNPDNMPTQPLPPGIVPPAPMPNVHSQQLTDQFKNLLESAIFQATVAKIRALLEPPIRVDDVRGILQRKRLLREAFRSVPGSLALLLLFQLQNRNDPLGKLFRYKLATPTRRELRGILAAKQTFESL